MAPVVISVDHIIIVDIKECIVQISTSLQNELDFFFRKRSH